MTLTEQDYDKLESFLFCKIPVWVKYYRDPILINFREGVSPEDDNRLELVLEWEQIFNWEYKDLPLHVNDFKKSPINSLIIQFRLELGR